MNETIRTLVWRELKIAKKYYIGCIVGVFILTGMFWLVLMSAYFGNIGKYLNQDDLNGLRMVLYYCFLFAIPLVSGMMLCDNGVLIADIRSSWKKYSDTLPVKSTEIVISKFAIIVAFLIAVLLFSNANLLIYCNITDRKYTFKTFLITLGVIDIMLAFDFLFKVMALRAHSTKDIIIARIVNCVVIFISYIASSLSLYPIMRKKANNQIDELFNFFKKLLDIFARYTIPAFIIIMTAGYFLYIIALKRREK